MTHEWKWRATVFLVALILLGLGATRNLSRRPPAATIVITSPSVPAAGLVWLAQGDQEYRTESLSVRLVPSNGKSALHELELHTADVAVVNETDFVAAVLGGKSLRILASLYSPSADLRIVARRNRGIVTTEDLQGKRVGIVTSEGPKEYFASFLLRFGIEPKELKLIDNDSPALVHELRTGELDAIALDSRAAAKTAQALGHEGLVLPVSGHSEEHLLLVGTADWVATHPETAVRLIRSLRKAQDRLEDNPKAVGSEIGRLVGNPGGPLPSGWIGLRLSQAMLVSLEEKARWQRSRQGGGEALPNFLQLLFLPALLEVDPRAVDVIH